MDEMTLIRKGVARNGFVLYALNIIDQVEQEGRFGTAHAFTRPLQQGCGGESDPPARKPFCRHVAGIDADT